MRPLDALREIDGAHAALAPVGDDEPPSGRIQRQVVSAPGRRAAAPASHPATGRWRPHRRPRYRPRRPFLPKAPEPPRWDHSPATSDGPRLRGSRRRWRPAVRRRRTPSSGSRQGVRWRRHVAGHTSRQGPGRAQLLSFDRETQRVCRAEQAVTSLPRRPRPRVLGDTGDSHQHRRPESVRKSDVRRPCARPP